MATDPLFQPIESLLNRNVAGSTRARELVERLEGRSLEVRATPTPLAIRFRVSDGKVSVSGGGEGEPDAVIEGSPLSLATLAGPQPEDRLRRGEVRISGDAETAQSSSRASSATRSPITWRTRRAACSTSGGARPRPSPATWAST